MFDFENPSEELKQKLIQQTREKVTPVINAFAAEKEIELSSIDILIEWSGDGANLTVKGLSEEHRQELHSRLQS